jgi:hypothetical protein
MLFQILSRPIDKNGNTHRLGLVYNELGQVINAYQFTGNTKPEWHTVFSGMGQLPTFHVNPKQFNETAKEYGAKFIR